MHPIARRSFLGRAAALAGIAPAAALAGTGRRPAPEFAPAVDPEVARRQDQLNNLNPGEVRFTMEYGRDAQGHMECRARVDCNGETYGRIYMPESLPHGREFGIVVTPDGIRGLNDPRPVKGRVNS